MEIQEFKKHLQVNYKSDKTIKTYLEQIRPFLRYCNDKITQEKIDDYMINRRKKATSTCNLFINAFKKYCELASFDFKIPLQKVAKTKYHPSWTLVEFEKEILTEFYGDDDLLLRTMFFTGLRPHELWNLSSENIDFKKEIFIINGKGGKERIIPFLDNTLLKKLKKHVKEGEKVFNINKRQLGYLFTTIKEKLSLNYNVTPYIMRRSFACYCDDMGMSIKRIKQLMGHENIETTDRYISENPKGLIEACKKLRRN